MTTPYSRRLGELVRFIAVSAGGLCVDTVVSLGGHAAFDIPLVLAALAGFSAGALFNYACHEMWTFGGGRKASLRRAATYAAVVLLTLCTRLASLQLLLMTVEAPPALLFAISVGISFTTSYLLSRPLFAGRTT